MAMPSGPASDTDPCHVHLPDPYSQHTGLFCAPRDTNATWFAVQMAAFLKDGLWLLAAAAAGSSKCRNVMAPGAILLTPLQTTVCESVDHRIRGRL